MIRLKTIVTLLTLFLLASAHAFAQDKSTGGIKGKVRVKGQGPTAGVSVTVRQGEREVEQTVTDSKGDFSFKGLAPGRYGMTFRKPGLSVGTLDNIEVKAGKTNELADRLVLTVNEAANALLRGSVFNEGGFSIPGIRVELARLEGNGATRKLEGRITNESGQFVYRLSPDKAIYRVTIKAEGTEPLTKDVEIDGAATYRIAFTIQRPPK